MMQVDKYGQIIYTSADVCDLYLKDPNRTLRTVLTEEDISFDPVLLLDNIPTFVRYVDSNVSLDYFDSCCQNNWFIPEELKEPPDDPSLYVEFDKWWEDLNTPREDDWYE